MDDDFSQCIFTGDDPKIAVTISHDRDRLVFGGKLQQDYRFISYEFAVAGENVSAKMYLDDPHCVSITAPAYSQPIPEPVMFYLQRRFQEIKQLGGGNGYVKIWK